MSVLGYCSYSRFDKKVIPSVLKVLPYDILPLLTLILNHGDVAISDSCFLLSFLTVIVFACLRNGDRAWFRCGGGRFDCLLWYGGGSGDDDNGRCGSCLYCINADQTAPVVCYLYLRSNILQPC